MKFEFPITPKILEDPTNRTIELEEKYMIRYYGCNNRSGFFPLGLFNTWHGGIHIENEDAIKAIADGRIIAYRVGKDYIKELDREVESRYSNSFVLIQHDYKSPKGQKLTFYSLYHHLMPKQALEKHSSEDIPNFLSKLTATVKADISVGGLLARSWYRADAKDPYGRGKDTLLIPHGRIVELDETESDRKKKWRYTCAVKSGKEDDEIPENDKHWSYVKKIGNKKYRKFRYTDPITKKEHKYLALNMKCVTELGEGKYKINYAKDTSLKIDPNTPKGVLAYDAPKKGMYVKTIPQDTEIDILPTRTKNWYQLKGENLFIEQKEVTVRRMIGKALDIQKKIKDEVSLDTVENVDIPIQAGDIVGHTGYYENRFSTYHKAIHLEVFTAATSGELHTFLNNKKEDADRLEYLTLPEVTLWKCKPISFLPKDTKVKLYQRKGEFAQIGFEDIIGYAKHSQLKYYSVQKGTDYYTIKPNAKEYLEEVNNQFGGQLSSSSKLYWIKGCRSKKEGENYVSLDASSSKRAKQIEEQNKKDKNYIAYRKLTYKTKRAKEKYWVDASALPEQEKGEKWVALTKDVEFIYEKEPKEDTQSKIVLPRSLRITKKKLEETIVKEQLWWKIEGTYKDKKNVVVTEKGWVRVQDAEKKGYTDLLEINPYNLSKYGWRKYEGAGTNYFYHFEKESKAPEFVQDIWEIADVETVENEDGILEEVPGDRILSTAELHRAMRDKEKVRKLSRMIVKHPSEWDSNGKNFAALEREIHILYEDAVAKEEDAEWVKELETLKLEKIESFRNRVHNLCFWSDIVDGEVNLPEPKPEPVQEDGYKIIGPVEKEPIKHDIEYLTGYEEDDSPPKRTFPTCDSNVYHIHPIAFVEHMRLLNYYRGDLQIAIYPNGTIKVEGDRKSTIVTYVYYTKDNSCQEIGTWEIKNAEDIDQKVIDTNDDGIPDMVYVSILQVAQLYSGQAQKPIILPNSNVSNKDLEELYIPMHRFEQKIPTIENTSNTIPIPIQQRTSNTHGLKTRTLGKKLNDTKYQIGTGDTFEFLEQKYELPKGFLTKINPCVNPNTLQIGQVIEFATRYRSGDTYITIIGDDVEMEEVTVAPKEVKSPYESDVFEDIQEKRAKDFAKAYDQGAEGIEKGSTADFWLRKGVPLGIGLPLIAVNPGNAIFSISGVNTMAVKGAIGVGTDMILNKGKFNAVGVGADMVMTPGLGNFIGSAYEVKVDPLNREIKKNNIITGKKTLEQFGVDFLGGFIFGARGSFMSEVASEGINKIGKNVVEATNTLVGKAVAEGTKKKIEDEKGE